MMDVPARNDLPRSIDVESLLRLVRPSPGAYLVLDYDGTLVPFRDQPDQATPDPELLELLGSLAGHHDRELSIVTGRTRTQVEKWLGALPIGLYAEHGVWCRPTRNDPWRRLAEAVDAWPGDVVDALEKACGMLPGSLLEVKSASLVFHYRAARRALVATTVPWLRNRLAYLAQIHSFRLVEGAEVLELRGLGVSKAMAARVILGQVPSEAALVAIGDDTTDEDLFLALPPGAVTIHVGEGWSNARYAIGSPEQVREFLRGLL